MQLNIMKNNISSVAILFIINVMVCTFTNAQSVKYADLSFSGGTTYGISASYVHNWKLGLGKNNRWEAGLGLRYSGAFATDAEFITSGPAKYTRGNTTPFVIVFAEQLDKNWDTLTVQNPLINSINISANLAVNITEKFGIGLNIDLVGFSFGPQKQGQLESNKIISNDAVKPTTFNVLLTGDHDIGSLNSEFFIKYNFNDHWGARGIYQFLFTEYETKNIEQTFYDGETNRRFRNKGNNFGLAVFYKF